MFGFKKRNYEERIRAALVDKNFQEAEKTARQAFADSKVDEHVLAWCAASIYERQVESAFDLLGEFVNRYPHSLHLPRVYLADILSRNSHFDQASAHARHYLRLARDAGLLPDLLDKRIAREGVSRSFLLLTSAYTTLGARSYSQRVLEQSQQYALVDRWKSIVEQELEQLTKELESPDLAALNKIWQDFFATGQGADFLFKKCSDEGFPIMAKRLDLLEGNFKFNPTFQVDDEELFLCIVENENQVSALW